MSNLQLPSENEVREKILYRELIGSLMYIMSRSRLDLTYFSQFQNNYSEEH